MLPPHRFDAQPPPASRTRHASAPRFVVDYLCCAKTARLARGADPRRKRTVSSAAAQSRSTASATPIPPPMHSDASPRFASRLT
ncbi:hypothetical protein, partial [Burkholderia cenocepacia]|uniref:hypothetical protein n=2 Tax=Burkholderia cenocepacia TaxID=95486 RepID=UPI00349EF797